MHVAQRLKNPQYEPSRARNLDTARKAFRQCLSSYPKVTYAPALTPDIHVTG